MRRTIPRNWRRARACGRESRRLQSANWKRCVVIAESMPSTPGVADGIWSWTRPVALVGLVALALVGCGHRVAGPGAAPKPIVASVLPQVRLEARTEFDAALRALS